MPAKQCGGTFCASKVGIALQPQDYSKPVVLRLRSREPNCIPAPGLTGTSWQRLGFLLASVCADKHSSARPTRQPLPRHQFHRKGKRTEPCKCLCCVSCSFWYLCELGRCLPAWTAYKWLFIACGLKYIFYLYRIGNGASTSPSRSSPLFLTLLPPSTSVSLLSSQRQKACQGHGNELWICRLLPLLNSPRSGVRNPWSIDWYWSMAHWEPSCTSSGRTCKAPFAHPQD